VTSLSPFSHFSFPYNSSPSTGKKIDGSHGSPQPTATMVVVTLAGAIDGGHDSPQPTTTKIAAPLTWAIDFSRLQSLLIQT
jgi:hypothetical protein